MMASVGFSVGGVFAVVVVQLVGVLKADLDEVGEFVGINKVFSGVIRRVNVSGFDFAVVGFLEQFENFQVIAFNEQVFGWCQNGRSGCGRVSRLRWRLVG